MWFRSTLSVFTVCLAVSQLRAETVQQPTGAIRGTVYCTDTHRPSRGAVMFLEALSTKEIGGAGIAAMSTTRVATDGTYAFEHVELGRYRVTASLPGYYTADLNPQRNGGEGFAGLREDDGTAVVTASGTSRLDIVLERGAGISGRVYYDDGSPASQVSIIVEQVRAKNPAGSEHSSGENRVSGDVVRSVFTPRRIETDDEGRFRTAGLHPGTYYVAAVQPAFGGPGQFGSLTLGSAPSGLRVYSAGAFHKSTAKSYEVRAGDEVSNVEITIPLDALHKVRGTVQDPAGLPMKAARLSITDVTDTSVRFQTTADANGSFQFADVPAATYQLAVANEDSASASEKLTNPESGSVETRNRIEVIVGNSDLENVIVGTSEVVRGTSSREVGRPH